MVVFVPQKDPKSILKHPVLGPILIPHAHTLFEERRSGDGEWETTMTQDRVTIKVDGLGSVGVIHLIGGAGHSGNPKDDDFALPRNVRSSLAAVRDVLGDIDHKKDDENESAIAIFLDGETLSHRNAPHVLRALGTGLGNLTYNKDMYKSEPGERSTDGKISEAEEADLARAIEQGWEPSIAILVRTKEAQYGLLQQDILDKKFELQPDPSSIQRSTRNAVKNVYLVSDVKDISAARESKLLDAFSSGDMVSRVQSMCKFLAEAPHNLLDCELFVKVLNKLNETVKAMGSETSIEIYGPNVDGIKVTGDGKRFKLDVLEAVHQGSGAEIGPFVVRMKYRHPKASGQPVHILAGKSLMFDNGGNAPKGAEHAKMMQGDMAGGASLAAEFARFGEEKPVGNLDFVWGIAANKADGNARQVEDTFTHGSGRTVEEMNPDAEGREVLGDTLWLAMRRLREEGEEIGSITTIATLTGAAILIGGHQVLAITSKEELQDHIREVSKANGERVLPLPLQQEDSKAMKKAAARADMANLAQVRWRGSQTGAAYIKDSAGVQDTPFTHFDIATALMQHDGTPKDMQGQFPAEGYLDTLHKHLLHEIELAA